MLFNSFEFLLFFFIVFILYWFVFQSQLKKQNLLILVSSYFFYGWWDWRFLSLIAISSIIDYFVGLKIYNSSKNRKIYLHLSVFINLALLGFFKYFNFFVDSFIDSLLILGYEVKNVWTIKIILPVGISFYTFQTMSYSLDIYRKKLKPTRDFISFAAFVSFFPQLVAGPIERASNLLPQILKKRKLRSENIKEGLKLVVYGYFMKIVIADNMAGITDYVFNNSSNQLNSLEVLIGIYAFTFQIYGDFCGYSSIARGIAKMLGFNLMVNFNSPYFSKNPSEFWSRWHISLSSWLRDYLYIPLGGNRISKLITYRNLLITMVLGGLWHGSSWNFIVWGLYHGIILCLYRYSSSPLKNLNLSNYIKFFSSKLKILVMFHLVCYSWLLFRCETMSQIISLTNALFNSIEITELSIGMFLLLTFFNAPIIFYEYLKIKKLMPARINFLFYVYFIIMLIFFQPMFANEFIYFQF